MPADGGIVAPTRQLPGPACPVPTRRPLCRRGRTPAPAPPSRARPRAPHPRRRPRRPGSPAGARFPAEADAHARHARASGAGHAHAAVLGHHDALASCPPGELRRVIDIDLTGTLAFTCALLPAVARGGAIVNLTSSAAGRPFAGPYAIAKLGLEGATRMLREELRERGIRCVALDPGAARTGMRAEARPEGDDADRLRGKPARFPAVDRRQVDGRWARKDSLRCC